MQTIENLRKRLVTKGFDLALDGKKRSAPPTAPKLDGEGEAKLIAMRLGKPPASYGHWTLQLLADELVALEVVDSISHETVRKTLKKGARHAGRIGAQRHGQRLHVRRAALGFPPSDGPRLRAADRLLLHAEARQLAECR